MARILKIYGKILAALLVGLGFSCTSDTSKPAPVEYGAPWATFKAKGEVVSKANNTPIEGIRAVLKEQRIYEGEYSYEIADALTNDKGVFNLEGRNFAFDKKLYVELTDIDGDANGLFIDTKIEADYSNETFKGASGWYYGEASKDLGPIKLEPKK